MQVISNILIISKSPMNEKADVYSNGHVESGICLLSSPFLLRIKSTGIVFFNYILI